MPIKLLRLSAKLSATFLLLAFVGCLNQPSWGIPMAHYKHTSIHGLRAPKGTITVWFDQPELKGTVRVTGPNTGQINPSPEDKKPGFDYGQKLDDGRVLSFRCLTEDGAQGTMAFMLNGNPFPHDKPFQLSDGRLFLVTTKGQEVKVHQLNREIRDVDNKAKLDELVKSDPKIATFVADADKSK